MATAPEISSIVKATEIMKCLSDGLSSLSDIARKLSYNKATVYRVLKTLTKVGLATQDPTNLNYYPGPLLNRLSGNPVKAHQALSQCALKHMEDLRDLVRETVMLQIQRGGQRLMIAIVRAIRSYMFFAYTGDSNPINTGAAGKVLLSQLSDKELKLLLKDMVFVSVTPKTIIEPNILIQQCNMIRGKGYAIEYGEFDVGGGAIAVPIKGYTCPLALSIASLESRLRINQDAILAELEKAALKISKEMMFITNHNQF